MKLKDVHIGDNVLFPDIFLHCLCEGKVISLSGKHVEVAADGCDSQMFEARKLRERKI